MSDRARNRLGILILAVSVAGLAWYTVANWAAFQQLSIVRPASAAPLVLTIVVEYFVIGCIIRALTRPLGLFLGLLESFVLALMSGFHNMVLPLRGGMMTRAVYLKARHRYSYSDFLASLTAGYVLMYLAASLLGLGLLLAAGGTRSVPGRFIMAAFGVIAVSLLAVVLFSPRLPRSGHRWLDRITGVINAWGLIKDDTPTILGTMVLSLAQITLEALTIYLEFQVFGLDVSPSKCGFLAVVALLGQLIQLTPAGLGVTEALLVFSAQTIAISPAEMLAATLLGRAATFLVLLLLGPISTYVLTRSMAEPGRTN